jgi:hypothetical protein
MKKIAYLFLIYDSIDHEELWFNYFLGIDKEKYTILIHYKNDKPLMYFDDYKLSNCEETKYADISICKATINLYSEALKIKNIWKLVLVSQACVPLKSFNYVYNELTRDGFSKFNRSYNGINIHGMSALEYIHNDELFKASQWSILFRDDAQICVNQAITYLHYFKRCYAPDELMFITILKKFHPNNIVETPNLAEGATTFTNWGGDYKFPYKKDGVKNYINISSSELNYLLMSPCLFGRKFLRGCLVDGALELDQVLIAKLDTGNV